MTRRALATAALFAAAFMSVAAARPARPPAPALAVTLDRSEADAALAIIDAGKGAGPTPAQIEALQKSRPYRRLHEREDSFNKPFTDAEFLAYLRSEPVRAQADGLHTILSRWTDSTIAQAARRAAAYLPAGSTFRATIFPMIKIKPNTFVFDLNNDPSIFYALNPAESPAVFENTLAHEMHHIGLGQNCASPDLPGPEGVQTMRHWAGAFGEGLAMLAAAGGPRIHPHSAGTPKDRALWDSEIAKVADYQREQNAFFRSVVAGTAGGDDDIKKHMFSYYGDAQGPWYSVGYTMAVAIERNLGRPAVVQAFCHPETLFLTYNRAASLERKRTGRKLPTWDPGLARSLAG